MRHRDPGEPHFRGASRQRDGAGYTPSRGAGRCRRAPLRHSGANLAVDRFDPFFLKFHRIRMHSNLRRGRSTRVGTAAAEQPVAALPAIGVTKMGR